MSSDLFNSILLLYCNIRYWPRRCNSLTTDNNGHCYMQGRGCECHLWLVMEQESKLVAEPGQAGWKKLKQSAITEFSISIAFFG